MKQQIRRLARLQLVETEMRRVRSDLAAVPGKIAALEEGKTAIESRVEDADRNVAELKKQYREDERRAQDTLVQISRSEEKLREVKTNKEYRSSLREIDELKLRHSKLEDQMITLLDDIEAAEAESRQSKDDAKLVLQQIQADIITEKEKAEALGSKVDQLAEEIESLGRELDPKMFKRFVHVRDTLKLHPSAVAAKDAVCQGCNMNIPPQLYNELQRCDRLEYCPQCQRLIYWGKCLETPPE